MIKIKINEIGANYQQVGNCVCCVPRTSGPPLTRYTVSVYEKRRTLVSVLSGLARKDPHNVAS